MFYKQLRFLSRLLMLLVEPKIAGIKNIPDKGFFIAVSDHFSGGDFVVLLTIFRRRLVPIAKSDNHPAMMSLIDLLCHPIFIKRLDRDCLSLARADRAAYKRILRCKQVGVPLLIFLPGTRSKTDQMLPIEPEEARWVAYFAQFGPVLPIGISGTWGLEKGKEPWWIALEVLKFVLRIRRVVIRIGKPIEELPVGRGHGQVAADIIGYEIARLVEGGHRGVYEEAVTT